MTARDSFQKVFRLNGLCIAALLLCQCQLPPRQAWQSIQTHGLFGYLGQGAAPSPPFGARSGYPQRYAATRGPYYSPRYTSRYQSAATPPRAPYQTMPSRYYSAPSQVVQNMEPIRPAPRSTAPRSKPRSQPPSVTRIPVEEPSDNPPVVRNESPAPAPGVASKSNGSVAPAPARSAADLPYGSAVPGRPNMVNSPYAGKTQLVDVSGMTSGQTVKCPYTGKLFKVPSSQQAKNEAEPKLESKIDTPKMDAEPKAEEKTN